MGIFDFIFNKKYEQKVLYKNRCIYIDGIPEFDRNSDAELILEMDSIVLKYKNIEKVIPIYNISVEIKKDNIIDIKRNGYDVRVRLNNPEEFVNIIKNEIANRELKNINSDYEVINKRCFYVGGLPDIEGGLNGSIKLTNEYFSLNLDNGIIKNINLRNIRKIEINTEKEIRNRITASRIIAIGLFALAFPKREQKIDNYLLFEIQEQKDIYNIIVSVSNTQEVYNKIKQSL